MASELRIGGIGGIGGRVRGAIIKKPMCKTRVSPFTPPPYSITSIHM